MSSLSFILIVVESATLEHIAWILHTRMHTTCMQSEQKQLIATVVLPMEMPVLTNTTYWLLPPDVTGAGTEQCGQPYGVYFRLAFYLGVVSGNVCWVQALDVLMIDLTAGRVVAVSWRDDERLKIVYFIMTRCIHGLII